MTPRPLAYEFGPFRLDALDKVLFRQQRPVPLTPKATETLLVLVERHGRLVTKEELIRTVWPDSFVEENNLAQHISLLRRVLGEGGGIEPFIETVPRRGYRFTSPVVVRFAETDELPTVIEAGPGSSSAAPPTRTNSTVRNASLIAAVSVAIVTVVAVSRTPEPPREASDTPSGGVTAVSRSDRVDGLTRIAVLPFLNLGSPADEYFVVGMTEEISSRLAGLSGLAVPSRTTITGYDPRGKNLRRVGADLGVEYLVEGSVRWAAAAQPTRVRITPKLIRVADDTTIWTHQYEAPLSNVFAVQADIAFQIAGALHVALDARERRSVEARPTRNTDAYLAYLRGISAYQQGYSDTTNQTQARADLEDAVTRDPGFALAWSWLARAYAAQYRSGAQRIPGVRKAAYQAAETAIALDAGLPEGHLALAQALFADRDYGAARRELAIARVGLPNSSELWQFLGHFEQAEGHWHAGRAAFMRAFDLDPAANAQWVAVHYLHMRQYPEAGRFVRIARAANIAGAVVPDAWTRFSGSGEVDAARPVLESALSGREPADARVRGLLARLEWFDGHYWRALELIDGMDEAGSWLAPNFRFPSAIAAGLVYESMGRREDATTSYTAAMEALEEKARTLPDDYQTEGALALAAVGLGRGSEALQHAERAVALLPLSKDAVEGTLYLYLLAQVQARVGRAAEAFATLDELFGIPGFYNEKWVQRDPGFAALRAHPSFRAHIDRWSAQSGEVLLQRIAASPRP